MSTWEDAADEVDSKQMKSTEIQTCNCAAWNWVRKRWRKTKTQKRMIYSTTWFTQMHCITLRKYHCHPTQVKLIKLIYSTSTEKLVPISPYLCLFRNIGVCTTKRRHLQRNTCVIAVNYCRLQLDAFYGTSLILTVQAEKNLLECIF